MKRELLRHVALEGATGTFTLKTWDVHRRDEYGKWIIAYEFRGPDGRVIFKGEDLHVPPMYPVDSDDTLRTLLGFLTLRPGDTDREYFEPYTERQMEFATSSDAEYLGLYAMEPDQMDEQYEFVDLEDE